MSSSIGCHLVPSNSHSVRFLDSFAIVGGIQTAHVRTRLPRVDTVARPASRSRDTEQVDAVGDVQIDGVNRDYCDDFVCTSSPLVEQTVKALARDLLRQRTWTSSLFSPSVEYRDGFRTFKGVEKYRRLNYAADCLKNPTVDILKLRMLDRGTAEALWRLGGTVGVIPISIAVTSTFKLDLITGNSSIAFSPIVKLVYAYVASAPLSKTMIGNLGNLGQVLTAICLPLMNICAIRSKVNRSSIGSCFMDVVAFACIFYPAMAQDILFPPMRPPKGRVIEHTDRWDLSNCSVQARLAFLTSRAWWSVRQALQDAKGDSRSVLEKLSIDEPEQQAFYRDPTDPTRFFHQEDNTFQDAILFAAVLGVFYVLVNAWRQLADLH